MTMDQVIQAGQKIDQTYTLWYGLTHMHGTAWLLILLFTAIVGLCFGALNLSISSSENPIDFWAPFFTVLIIGSSFLTFLVGSVVEIRDRDKMIEKWRNEIAAPFVQSLPEEKGEAIYLKIEPQIEYKFDYRWHGYNISRDKLTPLTVSFKRTDGIVTFTSWYNANMTLTNEQKPYVNYRYLEQNLGYGFESGVYYPKVYLPQNYQFTEIK